MRTAWMVAIPVIAITLSGCGGSHQPAQMPTLSQERIDAEEKHRQQVSDVEKKREEMLPRATYISQEEAVVNEAERRREAALKQQGGIR